VLQVIFASESIRALFDQKFFNCCSRLTMVQSFGIRCRRQTCKVILLTSLVWCFLDLLILMNYTDCSEGTGWGCTTNSQVNYFRTKIPIPVVIKAVETIFVLNVNCNCLKVVSTLLHFSRVLIEYNVCFVYVFRLQSASKANVGL